MKIVLLALMIVSGLCAGTRAYAQPFKTTTDFDGDSVSDITYTTTAVEKLLWKSVPSQAGGTALDESFGTSTDTAVLAHWLDLDKPTLCTIRQPTSKGTLSWKILLDGGVTEIRTFGKAGDLVLGGGDFNGNASDDAAVVRVSGKNLLWQIRYDLFTESSSNFRKRFGSKGDRAFYASADGERDWIGVFGKSGAKKTRLALFNPETKETISTKKLPRRLTRVPRPRPMPLKQEDGTDLVAFFEELKEDTRFSVYSLDGELVREKTFTGKGLVTIGDYLADESGEEIAFHSDTKIRYFNPVTEGTGEAAIITGIPIDETTATLVTSVATATPTPVSTATPTPTPTATE